jgi:organic hydroperoxide reductase OsmC/OhrA
MSAAVHRYAARITWARGDQPFTDKRYSRRHAWHFDGGAVVAGSSSPLSVPLPMSDASAVDPEEAFVASVSSCHMLWFLDFAVRAGWVVDAYEDDASGTMGRNAAGKVAMLEVAAAARAFQRPPARRCRAPAPAPRGARGLLHRQLGQLPDPLRADHGHRHGRELSHVPPEHVR